MKNKFFILIVLLCGLVITTSNYAFGYVGDEITLQHIGEKSPFDLKEEDGKVYVTYNGNKTIDIRDFDFEAKRYVVRIKSLYQDLVAIGSEYNEVLFSSNDFEYFEIDTQNARQGFLVFRTDEVEENVRINPTVEIYFNLSNKIKKVENYFTVKSDVENPLTIDEINSWLIAWDKNDGNVSSTITVIEENYTGNERTLGDYFVKLSAHDHANNLVFFEYTISVSDTIAPVIAPLEIIEISYKDNFDLDSYFTNVDVTDNLSKRNVLRFEVVKNTYLGNESKVGEYELTFNVLDIAGNKATATQVIKVVDNVAPVITGNSEIKMNADETLSINQILNNLNVVDEIDGVIKPYVITSNYEQFVTGNFGILIGAKDKSGNESTFTISIEVLDNEAPIIYINLNKINLNSNEVLSDLELLDLIKSRILLKYDTLEILTNEYENSTKEAGLYKVTLKAVNKDQVINFEVMLNVENLPEIIESDTTNSNSVILWSIYGGTSLLLSLGVATLILFRKGKKSN